MPGTVETAREAVHNHLWADAVTAYRAVGDDLSPRDVLFLAEALWWSGQLEDGIATYERAFALLEKAGQNTAAATVSARLAYLSMRRLNFAVGMGWISRTQRLLEGQPESEAHGWLLLLMVYKAFAMDHDLDSALKLADEALRIGREHSVPGIQALGLSLKATALIYRGDWKEGIGLVDEATLLATSGPIDLRASSDVYCNTIAMCHTLGDYRRAVEWTEKAERWMEANGVGGYPGVCQVHRAELKRLRGSWPEAESEARRACVELERFHIMDGLGFAQYEIGEVRRHMGDLANAEKAFALAYEYGHDAQPGMSLLLLDKGDAEGAARSIKGALERVSGPGGSSMILTRAVLLPAQAEIALATGDLATARETVEEMEGVARQFDGPTWQAYFLSARGALLLEEGDPQGGATELSRAWRLWQEIGLPFETARARMLLGRARRAMGDEMGATLELRAAASGFQQLGATIDLRVAHHLLGDEPSLADTPGERVTKVFMFTDIVTSTDLIGIIGDTAWENLLRWHDRTLREAIAAHGGEEVRHTGDGFFVAFDSARAAIECAVQIQRGLRGHRAEHGFSPWVRIGLHRAEATRDGTDYSGRGVHAAARIGSLADTEEVLVSADVVAAAGPLPYPLTNPRPATLKGITEPVDVVSLDWH